MRHDAIRATIAVFDLPERAERAVAELLADGYHPDQVEVLEGGISAAVASALAGLGVPAARTAYYAGEATSGRPLVVVCHAADDARDAMAVLGRYGGSVCVPPEVRNGRA